MTTRRLRSEEGISLRSNKKLPPPPPPPPRIKIQQIIPSPPSPSSSPLPHLQDLGPKNERQSTAPLCQAKDRERPMTRSRANSIHRTTNGPTIIENGSIPTQTLPLKKEEPLPPPSREEKEVPSPINLHTQDLSPQNPVPFVQNPKKILPKSHAVTLESQPTPSPYTQIRKSYRKSNKKQVLAFPYRKCHDPLQGRITNVLNKLTAERQCRKEMEGLADRLPKAGVKDIRNKYFVAGLKVLLRMAKEMQKQGTGIYSKVLGRLQTEEKTLQGRISEQLSDFSQWIDTPTVSPLHDPNASAYSSLVMKKLYSIMKRSHPASKGQEIKKRVVSQCRGFFAGEVSMGQMVRFLRKRMEV